ncbi:hypothetical protein Cadr_000023542 [Camelus dromedarius]|uniref:Uncharacterized protein n=1 Tax=Camelus dromedarius TaxID=9838 RepID=A0A5N4CVW5_CAMDR|nr:hypothetical protein Cadr_000023542 [Camelus dromedarius]
MYRKPADPGETRVLRTAPPPVPSDSRAARGRPRIQIRIQVSCFCYRTHTTGQRRRTWLFSSGIAEGWECAHELVSLTLSQLSRCPVLGPHCSRSSLAPHQPHSDLGRRDPEEREEEGLLRSHPCYQRFNEETT